MKKKRKFLWLLIPVLLIAAAGGALLWFRAHPVQTQAATIDLTKLTTTKVVVGSASTGISATGTVRTSQNASLSWGASGKVAKVLVKKGDKVEANQILAQLDPASSSSMITAQANLATAQQSLVDLKDVTVSQANAEVALINAQAAVDTAQDKIDGLYVNATQAQIDAAYATYLNDLESVTRTQEAFDKVSGYDETDVRRANALSALSAAKEKLRQDEYTLNYLKNYTPDKAILAQYNANLVLAKAQWVVAQASYDAVKNGPDAAKIAAIEANINSIQASLDQQYIRAPFAGTITTATVKAGDLVNNGTSAFRIDDMSALYIDLSVSEVDIDTVTVGQPVTLTFDALADKQYTGAITDIGAIGTVSGGVANFTVTLVMKDADQSVRPGMMATANVIVSQVNDVLLVPNHSITTTGQRKIIYVLANSQVTPVVVTVGMASDTQTEITSTNLKSGDVVVTNPTSVTTSTTTTTGVNSVFANLFRALGVTTTGGAAGQGGRVPGAGGFPQGGFDGTRGGPPSGNPPSGGD